MTNRSSIYLIQAIRQGDFDRASELIAASGPLHSEAWSDGYILLCEALKGKHTKIAKMLLEHGARVNSEEESLMDTPLHLAVKNNDTEIVTMLLDRNADVNAVNDWYQTPLFRAFAKNNVDIVDLLWRSNDHTHERSSEKIDALHLAANLGIMLMVEHFLNSGAFVDIVYEENGYTPLHFACINNKTYVVKLLLERGANINARTKNRSTALHLAAENECDLTMKVLLEHVGVDIDAENNSGKTVIDVVLEMCPQLLNNEKIQQCTPYSLHTLRSKQSRLTIVNTLLSHDISVLQRKLLLQFAVSRGFARTIKDFLRHGDVDSPNEQKNCCTLLHDAAKKRYIDIAEMLIKHGADVNAIDETGKSPIFYAIQGLDAKMTKLLVSNGAEIKINADVLCNGVCRNAKEIIEMMLDHDVNCDMTKGLHVQTVLWNVVQMARLPIEKWSNDDGYRIEQDLIELLLNRGAKVDINESEDYLLHVTARKGRDDIVKILLRYEHDVHFTSKSDMTTVLHHFAAMGNEEVLRIVLNEGAEVNAEDKSGKTALHYACMRKWKDRDYAKIVDTLLEFGAEIDHKDCEGFTPLHFATVNGSLQVVESLLKSFADVENSGRRTALFYAFLCGHPEIVEELLDYGANQILISPRAADLMKKHNIKITSLNIHGSKQNLASLGPDDKFKDFQAECESEVCLMKSERIGGTNVSYYDVFMKSMNQLAMLARNKDIVEALESCRDREKFPIYYQLMYYKFKRAQIRENLLNPSLKALNFLSRFPLPELLLLMMFDDLSNEDLENLIKAVPEIESRLTI